MSSIADTTLTIAPSVTKEIVFDFSDSQFKAVDTSALTAMSYYYCGTVVTGASTITSFTDKRQAFLGQRFSATFFEQVSGNLSIKDGSIPASKLDSAAQLLLSASHSHSNKTSILDKLSLV